MRTISLAVSIMLAATAPLAADLVNDAQLDALAQARESLMSARSERPAVGAVVRIGVVELDGDDGSLTPLLKSQMTKTDFDVVLISDDDLAPLLDEYLRQYKRSDLIVNTETAHELRQQGVDAILFGRADPAVVEPFTESGRQGERARVRMLLYLASLAEENPGSLIWSEQVTGLAEQASAATLDERLRRFYAENRLAILISASVAAVLIVLWLLRSIYRNAVRPR
jgi:hypothetical protein